MVKIVIAGVSILFATFAIAEESKSARWEKLITEAKKHGGVETVLAKSASYVFAGPDGLSVTFTRSLDNKIRLVCAGYEQNNIYVCADWNTDELSYVTREGEGMPWTSKSAPPELPEEAVETPIWLDLLSSFLSTDIRYPEFHRWHYRDSPSFVGRTFARSSFTRLLRGRHR